jgi:hypothetical protein
MIQIMCVRSPTVLVVSLSILYKSFPPNLKVQLTYYCIGRYLQKGVLIWPKNCHHRELEFMIPVNLYHTLHKWCIWNPLPTRVAYFAWIRRKRAQSWSLLVFNWKKFNKWSPLTFHMMLLKLKFSSLRHRWPWPILALLFEPFGLLATKLIKHYFSFQPFDIEHIPEMRRPH